VRAGTGPRTWNFLKKKFKGRTTGRQPFNDLKKIKAMRRLPR